jgi:hypothetical protein
MLAGDDGMGGGLEKWHAGIGGNQRRRSWAQAGFLGSFLERTGIHEPELEDPRLREDSGHW